MEMHGDTWWSRHVAFGLELECVVSVLILVFCRGSYWLIFEACGLGKEALATWSSVLRR